MDLPIATDLDFEVAKQIVDEHNRVATLESQLAEAKRKIIELGEQLEFDRSAVADCVTAANKAVDMRHWLTEGRGPYEWNDDNWHDEFRQAAIEIKQAIAPMTAIAANWKDCPMKADEVAQARIDFKKQADHYAALAVQRGDLLKYFADEDNWCDQEQYCGDVTSSVVMYDGVDRAKKALESTDAEQWLAQQIGEAKADVLKERDEALAMVEFFGGVLQEIAACLGTGKCSANKCDGCLMEAQYSSKMAREALEKEPPQALSDLYERIRKEAGIA